MKGFPEHVEGPMGPWYQKVNAAVAKVTRGKTVPQIREFSASQTKPLKSPTMTDDRTPIRPLILGIRNSYSCIAILPKRIRYKFDISNGRVIAFSKARYAPNRAFESGPPSAAAQRER